MSTLTTVKENSQSTYSWIGPLLKKIGLVLLSFEALIIIFYIFNIIFSYQRKGVFIFVHPLVFHLDMWKALLETSTFNQMIIATMPIAITAIGAAFNERAGVINIGLEGIMIWGAWATIFFTLQYHNPWIGVLAALIFGFLVALLHAIFTITFKAEQIVTGVAINLLSAGMTQVLTSIIWGTQFSPRTSEYKLQNINLYDIPVLGVILKALSISEYIDPQSGIGKYIPDFIKAINNQNPLIYIGFIIIPVAHIFLFHTTYGLRMRVIGEHAQAAATAGVPVRKYQYVAVLISGVLSAFGGAIMAVASLQFRKGMIGGRGFIALAAMIFGNWSVFGAVLGSVLFGYFLTLQIKLEIAVGDFYVPKPFLQMIPYVVTILAISGFIRKAIPPKEDGKPYDPSNE